MQFFYVVLGSCYLQEEKLQIIKTFTTWSQKNRKFAQIFSRKGSYHESEGLKPKQYFLSAFASSQKDPFLAENIKGSTVEINVNECPVKLPKNCDNLHLRAEAEAVLFK